MYRVIALSLFLVSLFPRVVMAEVEIFVCEPEWASLAKEIGGDKVEIFTAISAKQDPHYASARPSYIAKMRRSKLVFCSGSELETGWLPVLLRSAGQNSVQPGNSGYLMGSDFVQKLEVITDRSLIDRSLGDIHPEGNPHVHLNPHNLIPIAEELSRRLGAIDPDDMAYFAENFVSFKDKLSQTIRVWEDRTKGLKGKKVLVYHKSLVYLLDWLGIETVASIEQKPGIAPSAGYLSDLVSHLKNVPVYAILYTPHDNEDAVLWIANQLNLKAMKLPYTVGGAQGADSLWSLFDLTLSKLLMERE